MAKADVRLTLNTTDFNVIMDLLHEAKDKAEQQAKEATHIAGELERNEALQEHRTRMMMLERLIRELE
jgi:hypothetical protein